MGEGLCEPHVGHCVEPIIAVLAVSDSRLIYMYNSSSDIMLTLQAEQNQNVVRLL